MPGLDTDKITRDIAEGITELMRPLLSDIAKASTDSTIKTLEALKEVKMDINVPKIDTPIIPEIVIPEIKVPEANVTVDIPKIIIPKIEAPKVNVTVPDIKIPEIKVPNVIMPEEMAIKGWVQLQGVNLENPLPVQIRDHKGRPLNLEALTNSSGSGGGGGISSLKNKAGEKINPATEDKQGGLVSTNNSSTETLAGDAIFTGVGDDVSNFASVSILYKSDVTAKASGLSIQFSQDNVNWDVQLVGDLGAKTFQVHALKPAAKFFRVVYTNGSAAQSFFRLQCIFHTAASPVLITRGGQPQSTVDATPTRQVANIDLDFARKHIPGGRAFFFFGFNDDIDNAWEDVHASGGDINWLQEAVTVEIKSTHAADTSSGLGCRSVEIHGLSATGEDQDEVVAMGGTATTETALTYIRVNKMHNEKVGTYGGSHRGDITAYSRGGATEGVLLSTMKGVEGSAGSSVQYGRGEAGNGFWSVPFGKVMYITRLGVAMSTKANQTISIALYERDGLLDVTTPYCPRRVLWEVAEINEPHTKDFKSHIKIKALTDVWFRAIGSGSDNKIEVSLDFYLVDADADGA